MEKSKVSALRLYWRKFRRIFKKTVFVNDSPEKIARGFAIGVFWGVMPTFGLAVLFSLPMAVFLKANRLTAIMGTFLSNPFTSPIFMLWGTYIGNFVLNVTPLTLSWKILNVTSLLKISKSLFLGTFILAGCVAVLSYGLLLVIIPLFHKFSRLKERSIQDT